MKVFKIISIGLAIVLIVLIGVFTVLILPHIIVYEPDELDDYIELVYEKMSVAGIAVGIFDEEGLTSFYSYGKMDIEADKDITEDTMFQIASISKTVTGCAVMQLVERGFIDLDSDINEYFSFEIANPNYPQDVITTRMLLTHTSSIIDNWEVYDALYTTETGGGDSPVSLADFAQGYFDKEGQYFDVEKNFSEKQPTTEYNYSNCAYALLGYLVEVVSGQSFNIYCNENIFEPLGMENTAWLLSEIDVEDLAVPYSGGEALPHYGFATYPDGCLRTSVSDFQKFMCMMMNEGTYDDAEILDSETVKEIFTAQIDRAREDTGLTWELNILSEVLIKTDELVIGHTGGDPGVVTFAFFIPSTNQGVICFVNDDGSLVRFLPWRQLIKRLYEEVS